MYQSHLCRCIKALKNIFFKLGIIKYRLSSIIIKIFLIASLFIFQQEKQHWAYRANPEKVLEQSCTCSIKFRIITINCFLHPRYETYVYQLSYIWSTTWLYWVFRKGHHPHYIYIYILNAHKTEYMCYNQAGDITTLDEGSLKLVDKFTYLGSSVSSIEKDIDTRLTKAWTASDRLSIIWK